MAKKKNEFYEEMEFDNVQYAVDVVNAYKSKYSKVKQGLRFSIFTTIYMLFGFPILGSLLSEIVGYVGFEVALLVGIGLAIASYVMGGGLDRLLLWDYKYNKPGSNVKVVYDYAIKIHHPNAPAGTPPNIYLSHDLGNPLAVKPDEAESFVVELKRAFSSEISSEDYLIIGHVHEHAHNEQLRCVTLKEYSQDNHRSDYAIVAMGSDGFKVTLVANERKLY